MFHVYARFLILIYKTNGPSKQPFSVQNIYLQLFRHTCLLKRIYFFHRSVALKKRAGIFEPKGYLCFYALFTDIEHPIIIAFSRFPSRFPADRNVLHPMKVRG